MAGTGWKVTDRRRRGGRRGPGCMGLWTVGKILVYLPAVGSMGECQAGRRVTDFWTVPWLLSQGLILWGARPTRWQGRKSSQ